MESKERSISLNPSFRLNVLKSTSFSYVQNMIENMILMSYSDKKYLVTAGVHAVITTRALGESNP